MQSDVKKKRKYDLAIFDMDGTILNTIEDLTDSLNVILTRHGYPIHRVEQVKQFVGNGIRLLVQRGAPKGLAQVEVDKLYQEFMVYYQAHCQEKTRPYDGILPLLQALRREGYRTAVVSNKADAAVQALVEQYFSGLFDVARGERAGIPRKPAPDSVNGVLEELQIPRERGVYIGDSDVDLETARRADLDCIAVAWGFRTSDFLQAHGAAHIVATPQESLDYFFLEG